MLKTKETKNWKNIIRKTLNTEIFVVILNKQKRRRLYLLNQWMVFKLSFNCKSKIHFKIIGINSILQCIKSVFVFFPFDSVVFFWHCILQIFTYDLFYDENVWRLANSNSKCHCISFKTLNMFSVCWIGVDDPIEMQNNKKSYSSCTPY